MNGYDKQMSTQRQVTQRQARGAAAAAEDVVV